MMTRLYVSALAAGLLCLACTTDASAFDLFHRGGHGCGCDMGCNDGCAPACRPRLGSRLQGMLRLQPTCGICISDFGCNAGCNDCCGPKPCSSRPIIGYHVRKAFLMKTRHCGCDMGCGCGMDAGCGCGMDTGCGCGMDAGCGCDTGCGCDACAPSCRPRLGSRIHNFFHRLKPSCGCGAPSCGGCDMGCGGGCGC